MRPADEQHLAGLGARERGQRRAGEVGLAPGRSRGARSRRGTLATERPAAVGEVRGLDAAAQGEASTARSRSLGGPDRSKIRAAAPAS
ncbi:MAG: hypothetical protein R3B49_08945 [Phycisphaerales bacterium]